MGTAESLSHTRWECKYHLVWIPKCRRKVLYGQLRNHSNCLTCEMFITHDIPSCGETRPLSKSHAFVVCGALEKSDRD